MPSPWAVGDHVLARYWTHVDGPRGRWSLQRRGHVVTSLDPLEGIEFWHEAPQGYTEGQVHYLDPDNTEPYPYES